MAWPGVLIEDWHFSDFITPIVRQSGMALSRVAKSAWTCSEFVALPGLTSCWDVLNAKEHPHPATAWNCEPCAAIALHMAYLGRQVGGDLFFWVRHRIGEFNGFCGGHVMFQYICSNIRANLTVISNT